MPDASQTGVTPEAYDVFELVVRQLAGNLPIVRPWR